MRPLHLLQAAARGHRRPRRVSSPSWPSPPVPPPHRQEEGLPVTATEPDRRAPPRSPAGMFDRPELSTLDRFLAVWILARHGRRPGAGPARPRAGRRPGARSRSAGSRCRSRVGLLIMMYPVLAKVRYDKLDAVTGDRKLMVSSLVLNWLVGPALMFALAWIFLPDLPEYRTGPDHRRPRPLHRHGHHLERPGLRRPRSRRRPGRAQLRLPGPRVRPARLVLPRPAARLAGPGRRRAASTSPCGRSR